MSNYNNSSSADYSKRGYWNTCSVGRGGGGRNKHYKRSGYGKKRNNDGNERLEKNFPKFADNDYRNHNNEGNYYNDSKHNVSHYRKNDADAGIVPWHRIKPIIPLIIPPQPPKDNIEGKVETNHDEENPHNAQNIAHKYANKFSISENRLGNSESSLARTMTNSASTNITEAPSKELSNTQFEVKILVKQEKEDIKTEKQERKSSSSSSSSSDSSSSEESITVKTPTIIDTKKLPAAITPKANVVSETTTSSVAKKKAMPASSSSSSSEEEEEPPKQLPTLSSTPTKAAKTKLRKQETKMKSSKVKRDLEDDVVCIGNLENKIVLEDDSDQEEEEETQDESTEFSRAKNQSKTSLKKVERCMICDKKGHTSFQCQMICKNCSAPYHGYRTCPHPANLNTMVQLFLEFCMQQFQHFTVTKDLDINSINSVPKPQVNSPISHAGNKINLPKRKQSKTSDSNTKTRPAKKRKIYGGTKKNVNDNDDAEENSSDSSLESEDSTESEEDTTGPSTSSEGLISSKKRPKLKNKTSYKIPFSMSSFTPNPLNIPLVLNGFPNLTTGSAAATNQNTSNNALNTLLLTQMFQNAIGSFK